MGWGKALPLAWWLGGGATMEMWSPEWEEKGVVRHMSLVSGRSLPGRLSGGVERVGHWGPLGPGLQSVRGHLEGNGQEAAPQQEAAGSKANVAPLCLQPTGSQKESQPSI